MKVLYGAHGSPFVRKVKIFLAEKKVPYQFEAVIPVNVSEEYKKISPLGKIPAFRDDDFAISDSSVICEYLEKTNPEPSLFPKDPQKYARALWFEEYADTAMASTIGGKIFFPKILAPLLLKKPVDEEKIKEGVEKGLPPLFDYLESQVNPEHFLVGNRFSIADISVGSQIVNLMLCGFAVDAARWPKLAEYISELFSRPSFEACIEKEKKVLNIQ